MPCKKVALFLLVLLFFHSCFAVEIEDSSAVRSVKATVFIEGSGRITGNLLGQNAEIEILSFRETQNQRILSLSESFEINGKTISAERSQDKWLNNYALFKVNETGGFKYQIEAVIETNVLFPDLQEFDLENEISAFKEYAEPTENIESNHEAIRTVALNKFDSNSWLLTVVDVTKWVHDSVEYDLSYFPETYSALTTLGTKKGVCDEFAVLGAAMLRAKGIPTRLVTGWTYNPKEGKGWDGHAWLEAYNPNTGWIGLDPTFGEAGIVDGTHILGGIFPDPAEAGITKASAVQTASVTVEEKSVKVEAYDVQPFPKIFSIKASNVVMPANRWHDLNIEAKNALKGNVIAWFSLLLPPGFVTESKKKIILFDQEEEKQLSWKIRVDRQLQRNEYLTGTYKVAGLGDLVEKELRVLPGTNFVEEADIKLIDILPIVEGDKLVVEIIVENRGAKKASLEIETDGSKEVVEIGGFERREISITISVVENVEYTILMNGPGLSYDTTITVHEGKPFEKPKGIEQQPGTLLDGGNLADWITNYLFTMESALFAGIIIGVAVIGLLLKELLSK